MLTGIYFFLAGLIIERHRFLWLMPFTFLCFTAVKWLAGLLCSLVVPGYNRLSAAKRAWFGADVAHLIYSLAATAASTSYVRQVREGPRCIQECYLAPASVSIF